MEKSLKILVIFLIPFIFASLPFSKEVKKSAYPQAKEHIQKGLPSSKKVKEVVEGIKKGKIDIGEEYGMELGERWHRIHAEILEIDCNTCHIEKYDDNYLYQRKYKLPEREAPGVVKREICIKCHTKSGPAETKLY